MDTQGSLEDMQEKHDPQVNLFINRELSLLEFNLRVLKQARSAAIPVLERLRFLFICCNNLDEFFEVRVAGIKQQLIIPNQRFLNDGLSPQDVLSKISEKTHKLVAKIYDTLNTQLIPALQENNIHILTRDSWTSEQAIWVKHYFRTEVLPVVSPIAVDVAHPFPNLANKSLNFIVSVKGNDAFGRQSGLAIVHVPRSIPRVIRFLSKEHQEKINFLFLTSIIREHVSELFPGMDVTGCYQFRITRNSDLLLVEDEIEDLASALKRSLSARHFGTAVRLEVAHDCPDDIAQYLLQKHDLTEDEMYRVNGPVNLSRFMMILKLINRPDLHYPPFMPGTPKELTTKTSLFDAIREQDIMLHHPYQSFEPVLDLIREATTDEKVVAIKQTLYRTGPDSPIITALVEAARAGIEVTAVVEVRARYDEASNIELANRLQGSGALVVYGVVGYKTHAKMTIIVRREDNHLRRYVHMGTGNYHSKTAMEYTDIGLFTYDQDMGEDVHQLFQQLTGMGKPIKSKKILHAPFTLFKKLEYLIQQEISHAKKGKKSYIIAKMNALTDHAMIELLYEASKAGVKIDLIVRGICCLRPKIPGISENIHVVSIVGRFLEHSRIFYFYNGGDEQLYCSSADWMERNFYHRVETAFPITDKKLISELKKNVLELYLHDNMRSWELQADGSYQRYKGKGRQGHINAQEVLLERLSDHQSD